MNALVYYFSLPFIYLVSMLPMRLLYILSDILYFVLYQLLGYRRTIVRSNLRNAFPEKSESEINTIQNAFYHFFFDVIVEIVKMVTIKPQKVCDFVEFTGHAVFDKYFKNNQSVVVVMGHFGNWELSGARFSMSDVHLLCSLYHPLSNPHFDLLMFKIRTKFGTKLYKMKDVIRKTLEDRELLTVTAFIADQSAPADKAVWVKFLNQETASYGGYARIAKKLQYPIIYVSMQSTGRGTYDIQGEVLVENPQEMEERTIVELFNQRLERDIIQHPEKWLWSHNRWKHQRLLTDKTH